MVPHCLDLSLGLRKPYESVGWPTAKEFLTRENRVKVSLVRSDTKMSPEREFMNLNETGCKARIPVAILYGACGPAKAFNAPFWVIWGALGRYEWKGCDVNFEFRRRPRLVYGSGPVHQGEAHFQRRQQSVHCSVVWCSAGFSWTALRPFRKADGRDLSVLEQRPPRAGSGRRRGMNIHNPSFRQLSL